MEKGPFSEPTRLLGTPVSGVSSARMMHDFGVSQRHTVIMDLPLSLNPLNLARNKPVISYDPMARSRFGVFPRYQPDTVRWFETKACCIFHTANTWDSAVTNLKNGRTSVTAVNMLACRLTSASLVFSAGDVAAPVPSRPIPAADFESEQCRLYYFQFSLSHTVLDNDNSQRSNVITHQWGLSAIPFEFPSIRESVSMRVAKYVYGCSVSDSTFGAALGRGVKINTLVKMNAERLIQMGICNPPEPVKGCVDMRNVDEILASRDPDDPIRIFRMPEDWFAQEPRFVPRINGTSEDDGWLLSYVFDESQLGPDGECRPDARSELWIIDAKNMKDVVARIQLPQRVPYGLHGNWYSEEEIMNQRPIERLRSLPEPGNAEGGSKAWKIWMGLRRWIERWLA